MSSICGSCAHIIVCGYYEDEACEACNHYLAPQIQPADGDAISRSALIEAVGQINSIDYGLPSSFEAHKAAKDVLFDITKIVAATPAVEPQRVHAEWVLESDKEHSRCSNCSNRRNIKTQKSWEYCPKCGADMRGRE